MARHGTEIGALCHDLDHRGYALAEFMQERGLGAKDLEGFPGAGSSKEPKRCGSLGQNV